MAPQLHWLCWGEPWKSGFLLLDIPRGQVFSQKLQILKSAEEKDEARQGSLEGCVENWTPELRSIFVQPSWLSVAWQHVEGRVGSVFRA